MTALAPAQTAPRRPPTPHFVRDYRRFVGRLIAREPDLHVAMSLAAGGAYEEMGERMRALVVDLGLRSGDYLIDIGCGAGRLADALHRRGPPIRYLGCDVVPELLDYARARCPGAGWRFAAVDGLVVPEAAGTADMVVFFSVATHLSEAETCAYLADARRVLKPGGRIVVSYLDAAGWPWRAKMRFLASRLAHHLLRRAFRSVASSDARMVRLGDRLGLSTRLLGRPIGQSVCVYTAVQAASDSDAASAASSAGGVSLRAARRSAPA